MTNSNDNIDCYCVNCGLTHADCRCGDDAVWVERCKRCGGTLLECTCDVADANLTPSQSKRGVINTALS